MNLGSNIKKLREHKGYSQELVAEKLGVSRQAVSKWENNISQPSTDNLLSLSFLFCVDVDNLIQGEGNQPDNEFDEIRTTNTHSELLYCFNEMKTKTFSLIVLLLYIPINVYFYNTGIYGEVFIELGFFGKMFAKSLLYDIPFLIILTGLVLRFLKDRKDPNKHNVVISKKDRMIAFLVFTALSVSLLLVYFFTPLYQSIALFIVMFGLVYIVTFETIKELIKKEYKVT